MPEEEYQGYTLTWETLPASGSRRVTRVSVRDRGSELFSLAMTVTYAYAVREQDDAFTLSRDLALNYVHGLIDLDRFTAGASYEERRDSRWTSPGSEIDIEPLRLQLLNTLRQMKRAEPRMGGIPWLDVAGFALVAGVDRDDVRSLLSEMAAEGLVAGRSEVFGATLPDGRCEITAQGLRELRRVTPSREPPPSVVEADGAERPVRVFISYSHDSDEHLGRVRGLSDRLRSEGVECEIDQYPGGGRTGWPDWMRERIDWADFVLVVCTSEYLEKAAQSISSGVRWEALIISQSLYDSGGHNEKYVPTVFQTGDVQYIPPWLAGYTYYDLSLEVSYDDLYRVVTNQPAVPRRPLGELRVLEPVDTSALSHGDREEPGSDWHAKLKVLWTGDGGNRNFQIGWSPGAGFRVVPDETGSRGFDRIPLNAITVTYGAGRVLRFDTVQPLRLVSATLQTPDGTVLSPDRTGGGLPLDEWFAEFRNPP